MREILFRVWDNTNNKYAEPAAYFINSRGELWWWNSDFSAPDEVHDCDIEWYTGKSTDKGVKIFQGDKITHGGQASVVFYNELEFCWCIRAADKGFPGMLDLYEVDDNTEVIGSIHDEGVAG